MLKLFFFFPLFFFLMGVWISLEIGMIFGSSVIFYRGTVCSRILPGLLNGWQDAIFCSWPHNRLKSFRKPCSPIIQKLLLTFIKISSPGLNLVTFTMWLTATLTHPHDTMADIMNISWVCRHIIKYVGTEITFWRTLFYAFQGLI